MQPLNDLCKVKLETKRFKGAEKDTAESGILVELPDKFYYYGHWSFGYENSFMETEKLDALLKYWQTKIGRKIFWTALSERGNIIEKDGEKYAFIKLTSLIAEDDPSSISRSIHNDGAGSFGVEQ